MKLNKLKEKGNNRKKKEWKKRKFKVRIKLKMIKKNRINKIIQKMTLRNLIILNQLKQRKKNQIK